MKVIYETNERYILHKNHTVNFGILVIRSSSIVQILQHIKIVLHSVCNKMMPHLEKKNKIKWDNSWSKWVKERLDWYIFLLDIKSCHDKAKRQKNETRICSLEFVFRILEFDYLTGQTFCVGDLELRKFC